MTARPTWDSESVEASSQVGRHFDPSSTQSVGPLHLGQCSRSTRKTWASIQDHRCRCALGAQSSCAPSNLSWSGVLWYLLAIQGQT